MLLALNRTARARRHGVWGGPAIPAEGLQFDGTFWALDTDNTDPVDGAFKYVAPDFFIDDTLTSGLAVTYTAPDLFVADA